MRRKPVTGDSLCCFPMLCALSQVATGNILSVNAFVWPIFCARSIEQGGFFFSGSLPSLRQTAPFSERGRLEVLVAALLADGVLTSSPPAPGPHSCSVPCKHEVLDSVGSAGARAASQEPVLDLVSHLSSCFLHPGCNELGGLGCLSFPPRAAKPHVAMAWGRGCVLLN